MALTQISTQGIKDGTITGTDLATNVDLVDNQKLRFGTGNDLQIYHNGTNSFIDNITGIFYIRGNGTNSLRIRSKSDEESIISLPNGAVELYHNNSKKFETTSTGVDILGSDTTGSNLNGDLVINNAAGTRYAVFDASHTKLNFSDNALITLGTSNDLQIYHDGSNSFIDDSGTGNLVIRSSTIAFENAPGGGENLAKFIANGAVKFYHDNTQRFETVSNGFRLVHSTGNVDFHFNRFIVNAGQTFFIDHTATGADFQIRTSDSSGLDTTALQILGSGCIYNRCRSGSQANLILRKQITGADGIDYLQTRNQNNNLRTAIKGNGGISNYQSNDTNLSDETMKKNIVDCESIIEKFKQWKLRKFNYNSDVDGTPLTYGLIAQEIETLHSDLVSADFPVYESGEEVMKKTVKDHQLMMLSFKALQEAIAKIEVLETEVAALKAA